MLSHPCNITLHAVSSYHSLSLYVVSSSHRHAVRSLTLELSPFVLFNVCTVKLQTSITLPLHYLGAFCFILALSCCLFSDLCIVALHICHAACNLVLALSRFMLSHPCIVTLHVALILALSCCALSHPCIVMLHVVSFLHCHATCCLCFVLSRYMLSLPCIVMLIVSHPCIVMLHLVSPLHCHAICCLFRALSCCMFFRPCL